METRNTTAAYFIIRENFEEPVPVNYRDPIHVAFGEMIFEGKLPEFKVVLGPQIELPN
jgi:hypothetical protein